MTKYYHRETYYKREPNRKRYAIGYRCTTPDGVVKEFDNMNNLSEYTGYSSGYLKQVMSQGLKLKGMQVERIYS